jgi:hypothetical protein
MLNTGTFITPTNNTFGGLHYSIWKFRNCVSCCFGKHRVSTLLCKFWLEHEQINKDSQYYLFEDRGFRNYTEYVFTVVKGTK